MKISLIESYKVQDVRHYELDETKIEDDFGDFGDFEGNNQNNTKADDDAFGDFGDFESTPVKATPT